MLENNFNGKKMKVNTQDGKKLDCMFFPLEMKKREYLKYPTIIFFN